MAVKNVISSNTDTAVPALQWGTTAVVSYTNVSAQSAAISTAASNDVVVRITATTDCHVAIGANPTATTSDAFLPAGVVEYIQITGGQKIAGIRSSTSGSLFITLCN